MKNNAKKYKIMSKTEKQFKEIKNNGGVGKSPFLTPNGSFHFQQKTRLFASLLLTHLSFFAHNP